MPNKIDCLGFGIAPADVIMQIKSFPKPGDKINSTELIVQGGGPVPTAMVALAKLGFKPGIMSIVGHDVFGRFVIDELKSAGVDTSLIKFSNKPTAIASGWAEEKSGRRTIALDLNPEVKPSDINLKKLPLPQLIHLDGRYLKACMKLARWGRRNNIPIVLDIGSMRNDVTELLLLVDHLVCAEEYALKYTRSRKVETALSKLSKKCPGVVIITRGIKGAVGLTVDKEYIYQKAFRVKAVDTTGAGDAYHGAYLAGLLKGWDIRKRMKFSSAVGAINCTKLGGRSGLPTMRQAWEFLKRNGGQYA